MKILSLFRLTLVALLLAPSFASAQAIDVNAGPIGNQAQAEVKCPGVCASVGRAWTGQWRTTTQAIMSVCNCAPSASVPTCQKTAAYRFDEGANPTGAHRCMNHCHCDGLRTCSSAGWCQGTARPNPSPPPPSSCQKTAAYRHDEAKNPGGAHRCSNGCHCDGLRTCNSFGWCQGAARPPVPPPPSCVKSVNYHRDEAKNPGGSNRCTHPCHCDGLRTCSSGWCQGTSRPPARPPIDVNAGPILNQSQAQTKCPKVCTAQGRVWTGQWRTTIPNRMSVCNCK